MKTILAIGVSAAALIAVSSVANAQSDCLNGWHMIKDQIPVRCDMLQPAFAGPGTLAEPGAAVYEQTAPVEEPLTTGSIAPLNESEQPPRPGGPGAYTFAASRDECQPGQYWMMELNSGNRAVACE